MKVEELQKTAIDAAIKAGKEILKVYHSNDFDINIKSDNSPLTRADKIAHEIISEILTITGLPVLSEEGKNIPYETNASANIFRDLLLYVEIAIVDKIPPSFSKTFCV